MVLSVAIGQWVELQVVVNLQNGAGDVGKQESEDSGGHQENIEERVGDEEPFTAHQHFVPGKSVAGKEECKCCAAECCQSQGNPASGREQR